MTKKDGLKTDLKLAPSELAVADLNAMMRYYRDIVGLSVLESGKDYVVLGQGQIEVIKLVSRPSLAHASPREAGLFHNAIVFDSQAELSRSAGSTIMQAPQTFSGTADHLVSEAFYFNDPEGNGLELYYDRPAEDWTWLNGRVQMDTLYIDPLFYIEKYANDQFISSKRLGHVHLRVGDISKARQFYVDTLGFDITATMPGALFVSVGGYHHHLALNTWMSEGAGLRSKSLGLSEFSLQLKDRDDLNKLANTLTARQYLFKEVGDRLHVSDPWGNKLIFQY